MHTNRDFSTDRSGVQSRRQGSNQNNFNHDEHMRLMNSIRNTILSDGDDSKLKLFLRGIRSLIQKWTPSAIDGGVRDLLQRFHVDVIGGSKVLQCTSHPSYVSRGQGQQTPTNCKTANKRLPKKEAYYGADALRFGSFAEEINACTSMIAYFNHSKFYMVSNWSTICHSTKLVLSSIMHIMMHQHSLLANACKSEHAVHSAMRNISRFKRLTNRVFVQEEREDDSSDDSSDDNGSEADEDDDEDEQDEELLNPYLFNGLDTKIEHLFAHTNKPMKPLEFGIRFLYEQARIQGLCREGEEMRCRRSIPRYLLVKKDGEYLCRICQKPESEHPTDIGHRCSDHVFRHEIAEDVSVSFDTCSWERPENHYSVKAWVHKELTSELVPRTWRDTLTVKSRIIQEILNTVNESSLPVLDRQTSEDEYGPAVAFQNGVWFIRECIWKGYVELAEDQKNGLYRGLVTHYVHQWFHIARYTEAIKGAYDETMTDRPEMYRYENVYLNYVCRNCNTSKKFHKKTCRRPDFSAFQCEECGCKSTDITKPCECEHEPQYFGVDVAAGLQNVPTPFMDCVMTTQFNHLSDHQKYMGLRYWMFVMAGYFLLPKTVYDPSLDWPIIPCIFGEAGSGKSILMSALSKLVNQEKIGTLSSNAQETFGLEALVSYDGTCQKKYLILEASGKFKIPPQQFQSISCGEMVSINRKNKPVYSALWKETGFIIGNSKPKWEDNGGALRRRMILFKFDYIVREKDLRMPSRIEHRTLGAILYKSSMAMKDAKERFGSIDLLGKSNFTYQHPDSVNGPYVLPPTMRKWNADLQAELNPLYCLITQSLETLQEPLFLDNRATEDEERAFIPISMLHSAYTTFCKERFASMNAMDLTPDIYRGVFRQFNIKVLSRKTMMWQGQLITTDFVIGLGSVQEHASIYQQVKENQQIREGQQDSSEVYSQSNDDQNNESQSIVLQQQQQALQKKVDELEQSPDACNIVNEFMKRLAKKSRLTETTQKAIHSLQKHVQYNTNVFGVPQNDKDNVPNDKRKRESSTGHESSDSDYYDEDLTLLGRRTTTTTNVQQYTDKVEEANIPFHSQADSQHSQADSQADSQTSPKKRNFSEMSEMDDTQSSSEDDPFDFD